MLLDELLMSRHEWDISERIVPEFLSDRLGHLQKGAGSERSDVSDGQEGKAKNAL